MDRVVWVVYRLVKWLAFYPIVRLRYKLEVKGKEYLPKCGGYILASNHLGGGDTMILPVVLPHQISFAAKIELFRYPGLRQLLIYTGQIPLVRKNASKGESRNFYKQALACLESGNVLGIFPEGTRSKNGELLQFERGAGFIASRTGRQVVPIGISYSDGKLRAVVHITVGKPIDSKASRPDELTAEMRRRIAECSGQELAGDQVRLNSP